MSSNVYCTPSSIQPIEDIIKAYQASHLFNGDLLVAQSNKILTRKQMGWHHIETQQPFTDTTVFRIASITKQFTAAAVLLLNEEQKLNLHSPVIAYLPEHHFIWQGQVPSWANQITLHQLLTHTSGLVDYSDEKFEHIEHLTNQKLLATLITAIKNQPLKFNPGEQFEYCNTGYLLLSLIIDEVSAEKNIGKFLNNRIFKLLGMIQSYLPDVTTERQMIIDFNGISHSATRYIGNLDEPRSHPHPMREIHLNVPLQGGGAMVSSLQDLLKWNQALYQGKVLSPESFKLMTQAYISANDEYYGPFKYGYGLYIDDHNPERIIYYHGGWLQGARSELSYCPATQVSVIYLSNLSPDENQEISVQLQQLATLNQFALSLQKASS